MRLLAFLVVTGSLAVVGCGDTSAPMSVWNDSGAGGRQPSGGAGGQGGQGGQGLGGQVIQYGGSGGGVTLSLGGSGGYIVGGTVRVTGGTRDLATAQCVSTSGGACPVSGDYLACLEGNCPTELTTCYYSDGISKAVGGACRSYASCMLSCPCDAGKSACEDACLMNYATSDPCATCFLNLYACVSRFNCPPQTACSSSTGAASSGGVSGGYQGAGGAVAPPSIKPDAGPYVSEIPDASPYKPDAYVTPDLGPVGIKVDALPLRSEVGLPVIVLDALPRPVDLAPRIPNDGHAE
jgi:hypothetical protein